MQYSQSGLPRVLRRSFRVEARRRLLRGRYRVSRRIATSTGRRRTHVDGEPGVFSVLRSHDLASWTAAWIRFDDAATRTTAMPIGRRRSRLPTVNFIFTIRSGAGIKRITSVWRVSERPEGPYRDMNVRVTDPFRCPFAIDASPFQDDDGQWYLFYARDFLDASNGAGYGTGVVVDRLVDMTRLAGEERVVVRARSMTGSASCRIVLCMAASTTGTRSKGRASASGTAATTVCSARAVGRTNRTVSILPSPIM